jgi:hypothetical protein
MTNEEFKVICDARIAAAQAFTATVYARCQRAVSYVRSRISNDQHDAVPNSVENGNELASFTYSLPPSDRFPLGSNPGQNVPPGAAPKPSPTE